MNFSVRHFAMASAVVAGVMPFIAVEVASAKPGDLDPTFGEDGRVFFNDGGDFDIAATVLQQHDGKLVVGRTNGSIHDDFSVLRFETDGSRDTSFDGDGRSSIDIAGIKGTTRVVLQQADGKIVAAGTASTSGDVSQGDFGMARYNADGSLDATFGIGGVVIHDLGGRDSIASIVQQADGRLVAGGETDGGESATPDMAFVRFNTDGSLDRSFGQNGAVIINFHESNGHDSVRWLVLQSDGALIATGSATPSNSYDHHDMPIVRLLPDGVPDATLDGDGRVTIALDDPNGNGAGNLANAASLAAGADGAIVVVGNGNSNIWAYDADTPLIARVNGDGSPDLTFGHGGSAWIGRYGAHLQGLAIAPDGFLYVAGSYLNDHFVTRVTSDGELDTSFGVEGIGIIDAGDGNSHFNAGHASLIRQADGKIVTVSSTTDTYWEDPTGIKMVIARLLVGDEDGHAGLLGFHGPITTGEGTAIQVPVRRTGGTSGSITIDYMTVGGSATSGSDFTPASGTLSWGDGDSDDKVVEIDITGDATNEGWESFTVELSNPSGGATLASSSVPVQIEDEASSGPPDPPPASGGGSGGGGAVGFLALACLLAYRYLLRRRRTSPLITGTPAIRSG